MSSSLDDKEPYEFFQDELDILLNEYKKYKSLSSLDLHIINSFIEYACNHQYCRSKQELLNQNLKEDFISYYEIGFKDNFNKEKLIEFVDAFIQFIH